MKRVALVQILIICILLCGCGNRNDKSETIIEKALSDVPYDEMGNLEESYNVPESIPGVIIDRTGYRKGEEKRVIFAGEDLASTFYIVDTKTGDKVYEGTIKSGKDASVMYGDFTEYDQVGTYYIVTDVIGRSYDFEISEDMYAKETEKLLAGITMQVDKSEYNIEKYDISGGLFTDASYNKDVISGSNSIIYMLLSYELNSDLFTDSDNGIPDILDLCNEEAHWLLKMQDQSGGVSAGVMAKDQEAFEKGYIEMSDVGIKEIELNATASFIAALSEFSIMYREYDEAFANECLYQAQEAYAYPIQNRDEEALSLEYWYMANAELYKATGKDVYGNEVIAIREQKLNHSSEDLLDPLFIADYAYLTVKKIPDITICSEIMESYLDYAAMLSDEAQHATYLVKKYEMDENMSFIELLNDMKIMTYVNYVITNKEYRTVIQNYMHFLNGRNERSVMYLEELEDSKELHYKAVLLLIMSNIENKYVVE